ncbi:hypothetical protein LEP1GSC193_0981 [Leptospira alstonii serovar Pingchang str. 80-412]|uniref:Uncharacterized protein n=2 Tax=Leptospira alstonii TaxID=28452 RepID=M6CSS7_9LEPT|nr:hypothetical protein LEP1GSC194_0673 [Leptospira alstonii serovar Sichuan str. 79601]EQA82423.1 hypothetical protein LEP1GSC193_0981 [Leptospira alstonii serovar Pingchang str. 80-412]
MEIEKKKSDIFSKESILKLSQPDNSLVHLGRKTSSIQIRKRIRFSANFYLSHF